MPDQLLCCDIRVSPIIDEDKESVILMFIAEYISKSSTRGPIALASRADPGPAGVKLAVGVKSPTYIQACMCDVYDRAQSMHMHAHIELACSVFPVNFKAGRIQL
jgi:hypothetical protein